MGIRSLSEVGGLLLGQVAGACGNGVQHGLPDMGGVRVDQGDGTNVRILEFAQCRGDFQPCYTTTYDHDARWRFLLFQAHVQFLACNWLSMLFCMGAMHCRTEF